VIGLSGPPPPIPDEERTGRPARGQADNTARSRAEDAARASGVEIRELVELDDLVRFCALVDDIWHPNPGHPPVTAELLRALAHAGNYVAGAFADDHMVGVCAGFQPSRRARHAFAHRRRVPGAARQARGLRAQAASARVGAVSHVRIITWTFDPLVCRNAYFNIAKLAAMPAEYLPDFYGEMDDVINGSDDSDRLLVHWPLAVDSGDRLSQGLTLGADAALLRAAGATVALDMDADGRPVIGDADPAAATVLVRVPPDIEALGRHDQATARRWRRALRHALGGLMADGAPCPDSSSPGTPPRPPVTTVRTSLLRSSCRTATCQSPPGRASALSPSPMCWTRSPRASSGCRTALGETGAAGHCRGPAISPGRVSLKAGRPARHRGRRGGPIRLAPTFHG
jgi:predicted GNAT superfamily acetyltransferase